MGYCFTLVWGGGGGGGGFKCPLGSTASSIWWAICLGRHFSIFRWANTLCRFMSRRTNHGWFEVKSATVTTHSCSKVRIQIHKLKFWSIVCAWPTPELTSTTAFHLWVLSRDVWRQSLWNIWVCSVKNFDNWSRTCVCRCLRNAASLVWG